MIDVSKILEFLKKQGLLGGCVIYIYFSTAYFKGWLEKSDVRILNLEAKLQDCYEERIEANKAENFPKEPPKSKLDEVYAILPKKTIIKLTRL